MKLNVKLPLLPIRFATWGRWHLWKLLPGHYPAGIPVGFGCRLDCSFAIEFASTVTRYSSGYQVGRFLIDPLPFNRTFTLFSFGTRDDGDWPWIVLFNRQFN